MVAFTGTSGPGPLKQGGPRQGMWVVHKDLGVGIINALFGDVVDFHRVNSKGITIPFMDVETGTTKQGMMIPVSDLRQASLAEIPEARRPTPEHGAKFGYR